VSCGDSISIDTWMRNVPPPHRLFILRSTNQREQESGTTSCLVIVSAQLSYRAKIGRRRSQWPPNRAFLSRTRAFRAARLLSNLFGVEPRRRVGRDARGCFDLKLPPCRKLSTHFQHEPMIGSTNETKEHLREVRDRCRRQSALFFLFFFLAVDLLDQARRRPG